MQHAIATLNAAHLSQEKVMASRILGNHFDHIAGTGSEVKLNTSRQVVYYWLEHLGKVQTGNAWYG
jgi:hypothetical protein